MQCTNIIPSRRNQRLHYVLWPFRSAIRMCIDAKRESYNLSLTTTQGSWKQPHHPRSGVRSCNICPENMVSLPLWNKIHNLHGSKESSAHIRSNGAQHEIMNMVRIIEWLRMSDPLSPWQSQWIGECFMSNRAIQSPKELKNSPWLSIPIWAHKLWMLKWMLS